MDLSLAVSLGPPRHVRGRPGCGRCPTASTRTARPLAVVGFALTLTLVWVGTLGYGLLKLVELAL
jgi:hypothetical protein